MPLNPQEIWKEIINRIKPSLSEQSYELWIEPVKPLSFEKNNLILQIPNRFFSQWIKDHFQNQIEQLLYELTHQNYKLSFVFSQPLPSESFYKPIAKPYEEPSQVEISCEFNPKYTFENFVVGPSNRFASATAEAVAKEPGRAYNPLFIYGGVGLGKTHLLQAIGNKMKKGTSQLNVLYATSEKFTNELIDSIQKREMTIEFRNKYRCLDALLIDDIQFIAGKESTQEEFFHVFNTLYEAHKQIVISSDSTPKDLPTIEERLRSRFQWGVIADIQPPDLETRIAILRKKSEGERIVVPDDVIVYIASQIKSNIRELEGCLIRIVAFSSLTGTEITVDRAKEILKDIITKEELAQPITIEAVQNVVAKHFNVSAQDMKSKKRTDAIAFPRQIAMYIIRTLTEHSTTDIGNAFGGRDHTTVMYAVEKIKNRLSKDPYFVALINKIIQEIKKGKVC